MGICLAKKAENFDLDPTATGKSKDLPLHNGRHDKWDDLTVRLLRKYEDGLRKSYKKLEIPPIEKEELQEILLDIEEDLLFELKKKPKRERLK